MAIPNESGWLICVCLVLETAHTGHFLEVCGIFLHPSQCVSLAL